MYEKHFPLFLFSLSFFLTLSSLAITYFFLLPSACKFFLSFEVLSGSPLQIHLEAKIFTHITLVSSLLFRCHFIFQLPVPVLIFLLLGFLDSSSSIKKRRFFYLFPLFFTVPISPSDSSSQFLPSLLPCSFSEFSIFPSRVLVFTFPLPFLRPSQLRPPLHNILLFYH